MLSKQPLEVRFLPPITGVWSAFPRGFVVWKTGLKALELKKYGSVHGLITNLSVKNQLIPEKKNKFI